MKIWPVLILCMFGISLHATDCLNGGDIKVKPDSKMSKNMIYNLKLAFEAGQQQARCDILLAYYATDKKKIERACVKYKDFDTWFKYMTDITKKKRSK